MKVEGESRKFEYVSMAETKVAYSGIDESRGLATFEQVIDMRITLWNKSYVWNSEEWCRIQGSDKIIGVYSEIHDWNF